MHTDNFFILFELDRLFGPCSVAVNVHNNVVVCIPEFEVAEGSIEAALNLFYGFIFREVAGSVDLVSRAITFIRKSRRSLSIRKYKPHSIKVIRPFFKVLNLSQMQLIHTNCRLLLQVILTRPLWVLMLRVSLTPAHHLCFSNLKPKKHQNSKFYLLVLDDCF